MIEIPPKSRFSEKISLDGITGLGARSAQKVGMGYILHNAQFSTLRHCILINSAVAVTPLRRGCARAARRACLALSLSHCPLIYLYQCIFIYLFNCTLADNHSHGHLSIYTLRHPQLYTIPHNPQIYKCTRLAHALAQAAPASQAQPRLNANHSHYLVYLSISMPAMPATTPHLFAISCKYRLTHSPHLASILTTPRNTAKE